jgi:hypothetical protein
VVRGTNSIIQRLRKKITHAYRLYGLLETTQVEIVSNPQTERTGRELLKCHRPEHMKTRVKCKSGEKDNERPEKYLKTHITKHS